MIRQSLIMFIQSLQESENRNNALQHLNRAEFHKRLRNELIMLPIPKAKFNKRKIKSDQDSKVQMRKIVSEQRHCLKLAMNRVRNRLSNVT